VHFTPQIHPGSANGSVLLKGNNGVSLASALHWYLKYTANSSITWGRMRSGEHLELGEVGGHLCKRTAFSHPFFEFKCFLASQVIF
jgi:alpha-N-acetylglucosaminidase